MRTNVQIAAYTASTVTCPLKKRDGAQQSDPVDFGVTRHNGECVSLLPVGPIANEQVTNTGPRAIGRPGTYSGFVELLNRVPVDDLGLFVMRPGDGKDAEPEDPGCRRW